MIEYEPGNWGPLCSLHGSVLTHSLKWAVAFSVMSGIASWYINEYYQESRERFHSMGVGDKLRDFSFILGFLMVFRSNKAYSRWWEGGTLLQQIRGEWFNAFSSLLAFSNADPRVQADVHVFQHKLARIISMLYAQALKQVSTMSDHAFELIEIDGFDQESLEFLLESHDACEIILQWVQRLIVEANSKDVIKIAPPILARVYNQLGSGIVRLNNVRKIRDFPIPFPLAQMVAVMLLFHSLVTTFVCAISVDYPPLAAMFCFAVVLTFWSVHHIAVELEMPFGDDPNDLPLHGMMTDLNKSLKGLLNPLATSPPEFYYDHDFHNKLSTARTDLGEFVTALVASGKGKKRRNKAAGPSAAELFNGVSSPEGVLLSLMPVPGGEVIDNCFDGSADQGRADLGSCDDKEYRDSNLAREPRGGNGMAAWPPDSTFPTVMMAEHIPKMQRKDLPTTDASDLIAVRLEPELRLPYWSAGAGAAAGGSKTNSRTDALIHDADNSRATAEPRLLGAATGRCNSNTSISL